ncbi:hypothetical protein KR044_003158 [Drosophila immigrans]|nr:hypothetical protein KR044_003158 [Drosophila immigrans]
MDLAGKNVVYLGGFGGIGQKTCSQLLERQLQALAVFDLTLNEQILAEWQFKYPNTKIFYQKVDITQRTDIEAAYKEAVERLGHLDLVVNGMGLMDDRHIELTIQINLMGVINSCLIALDYMDKSKGGQGGMIVNISSVAGIQPTPLMSIYSAAKHGVTALTRSLSNPAYFDRMGVSFVTICPGFTDTPLLHEMADKTTFKFDTPMKMALGLVKRQPPQVCAENIVKVVEQAKNGSTWLLDVGEIKELEFPVMWTPQIEK